PAAHLGTRPGGAGRSNRGNLGRRTGSGKDHRVHGHGSLLCKGEAGRVVLEDPLVVPPRWPSAATSATTTEAAATLNGPQPGSGRGASQAGEQSRMSALPAFAGKRQSVRQMPRLKL